MEQTHILLVDDQPSLLDNIRVTLESAEYQVSTAIDGHQALNILQSEPINLILADIAMPGMNGYQLYERVRQNREWVMIPFIFLTARALNSDIRYGKELGVDDYLTKPIEVEDLLAAVNGKLRRTRQLAEGYQSGHGSAPFETSMAPPVFEVGTLKIDTIQYQVWFDEELLKLSAKEFKLLEYMARRANQVLSPTQLIHETHDLDTDHVEAGSLLRPMIRTLRRKLGYDTGDMGCIENVRGVGYRLVTPE